MNDYIYKNVIYSAPDYKAVRVDIVIPYADCMDYKQAMQEGDCDSAFDMLSENLRERYPYYNDNVRNIAVSDILAILDM